MTLMSLWEERVRKVFGKSRSRIQMIIGDSVSKQSVRKVRSTAWLRAYARSSPRTVLDEYGV